VDIAARIKLVKEVGLGGAHCRACECGLAIFGASYA
jgi:hypothetical protein